MGILTILFFLIHEKVNEINYNSLKNVTNCIILFVSDMEKDGISSLKWLTIRCVLEPSIDGHGEKEGTPGLTHTRLMISQ
jgi:hypothetical protein